MNERMPQENVVAPTTRSGVSLPAGSLHPANYVGDPQLGTFVDWDTQFMQKGLAPPAEAHVSGSPSEWRGQPTGDGKHPALMKGHEPGDPDGRLLETNTGQPYKPGIQGDDPYEGSAAGQVSEYHPSGGPGQPAPAGVPPAGDAVAKMSSAHNPMPFANALSPMIAQMHGKQSVPGLPEGPKSAPVAPPHEEPSAKMGPWIEWEASLLGLMQGKKFKRAKMQEGFGPSSARMKGKQGGYSLEGRGGGKKIPDFHTDENAQKSLTIDDLLSGLLPMITTGDPRWVSSESMQKGKGEGSRGGKIIGHTKSGKPIYAVPGHLASSWAKGDAATKKHGFASEGAGPAIRAHNDASTSHFESSSKGYSSKDHKDAAEALEQHKRAHDLEGPSRYVHNGIIRQHHAAAEKKAAEELTESQKQHDRAFLDRAGVKPHHEGSKWQDSMEAPDLKDKDPSPRDHYRNPKGKMSGYQSEVGKWKSKMRAKFRRQDKARKGEVMHDIHGRALRTTLNKSDDRVPEEYLYDYLCANIEDCYEQQRRETEHQNVSARDQIKAMAQNVMHDLVKRLRWDPNLVRACKRYSVTMPVVEAILIEKGIYKPRADSDWASDKDQNAAMGMPVAQGIPGSVFAFSMPANPWQKSELAPSVNREMRDFTQDVSHLVKSDDRNPFTALQHAEEVRMRALYGGGDSNAVANVASDCPVHNGVDINKAQNLHNAMLPCTCGAEPNPYG